MLVLRISFGKHIHIDNGMTSAFTAENLGHVDTDTPELLCGVRGPSTACGGDTSLVGWYFSQPCLPVQYKESKATSLQTYVGPFSGFILYQQDGFYLTVTNLKGNKTSVDSFSLCGDCLYPQSRNVHRSLM